MGGSDPALAIRIWALTHMDMQKVGAYEAAKTAVDKIIGASTVRADLWMIDRLVEETNKRSKQGSVEKVEKRVVTAVAVALASVLIYLLYILEQRSIAQI